MSEAVLEAELVAACSSLGYSDGNKYVRDPDCVETLRDLLRYLRRDDSSHQIRLALGETRVLQTDLIPLLREHAQDRQLLDLVLRLLVNLTSPALLVFHQEVPEDKAGRQMYLKLITQQQAFKEAFTEAGVWGSIASVLSGGLQQEGERDDDTSLVVEMCLVLLRNVLAVAPGRQDNTRTHDDADLHDQVLWSLHLAALPDLLLYLSSCQHEADLSLHTLEIISLMLRQQDPHSLATSALHRSKEEQKKDEAELTRVRECERVRRQEQTRKHYNARHSRFGGTYYVQNMKSISDRDIISHQPVRHLETFDFDKDKKGRKIPKNRAPLKDSSSTRRSTLAIRLFLQEFCVEFLNGAYNNIMYIVKDNLNRARTQEHDESYYLWAMSFFMEFNRHLEFKLELVSETLSIQTVHYVQTNIENYLEMMTTEKKKIPLWSRRMHNGLKAYMEILQTLAAMDKSEDESVRSSSMTLKSKIFYVVEYRELPLVLLQNYDQVKMSKNFLKDLVETVHIFLKLLEGMCKKTKHLMVQLPQKKKAPKKKKKPAVETASAPATAEQLEETWTTMADELSSLIQGEAGELPPVIPFDALSELTEDQQKERAMRKVNALLRKRTLDETVALFRASREVWPEGDIFGAQNIDASQEFVCLRAVFMADLNPVEQPTSRVEEEEEDDSEEDEEERAQEMEESSSHFSERELDFPVLIRRFAHIKIMQAYSLLLKNYASNTDHTNRCIIKMFHRLAWDSKLAPIFFQSSLFITFHQAMTDPARKSNPTIGEIVKFAKYIVRQFFKVSETNPKVFMEILFWKNTKEALDIECGYDVPDNSKVMKSVWTEEEEDELARLYDEFKDREMDPDDEKDLADVIVQNLIRQDRSRRLVIKKMKELGLIENVKQLTKKPVKVRGTQWTETEETELKVLFEENKDAMDPLARILDFMVVPKPKHRVVEKLLELGIIQDKSEVKKKKVVKPKAQKSKNSGERFLSANNNSDEDDVEVNDSESSEDESEVRVAPSSIKRARGAKPATAMPVITPHLISVALNKVMEKNMQDSIQWIMETLTEVADDREQDGEFEPIPILTINEEQTQAIEDVDFQSLMKIIGLKPPETQQEMFWRVPAKLTIEGLRKRAQYLTQGLAGTLPSVPPAGDDQGAASLTEAVNDAGKNKKKSRAKNKPPVNRSNNHSEDEESGNEKENRHRAGSLAAVEHTSLPSDSDEEALVPSSNSSLPLSAQNTPVNKRNKIRNRDFDNLLSSSTKQSSGQSITVDSDGHNKSTTKKRKIITSENDTQSNDDFDKLSTSVTKSASKKRRIVVNDSDDEDEPLPAVGGEDLALQTEDTEGLSDAMDVDESSKSTGAGARGRIVDSDDDVDSDEAPLTASSNMNNTMTTNRKKTAFVDSDEEEEGSGFIARSKARAIIDSDEDL